MSNIIKYNRINEVGTIQLGEVEEQEILTQSDQEQVLDQISQLQQMTEEATQEATRILEEAKVYAEQILEEARAEQMALLAHATGEIEASKKTVDEEHRVRLDALKHQEKLMQDDAILAKAEMIKKTEHELVELLKLLLERVVATQIVGKGHWLEWVIQKMLYTENVAEPITIYLAPTHYDIEKDRLEEKMASFSHPVTIEEDRTLTDTMCAVETSTGRIQYDVKEGLQQALEDLDKLQALTE